MFNFDLQGMIQPFVPHLRTTRDVAVRSVSLILERLDDISENTGNPMTVEATKRIALVIPGAGVANAQVFHIPAGEFWKCTAGFAKAIGGSDAFVEIRDSATDGGLIAGGQTYSTSVESIGVAGWEIRGPQTVSVHAGTSGCEIALWFAVARPKAKVSGRFAGMFEQEIGYTYAYQQEAMQERHFNTQIKMNDPEGRMDNAHP